MSSDDNLIIETKRLRLRPTVLEDTPFILELMNTDDWLKYIGNRNISSEQDAADYIARKIQPQFERLGFGNFTVTEKASNKPIGTCGLYDREGLEGFDLGFAFLPEFYKKSYGFESADSLMKFAEQQLSINQLNAITSKQNIASQKLLIKLGFSFNELIQLAGDDEELMLYRWSTEKK